MNSTPTSPFHGFPMCVHWLCMAYSFVFHPNNSQVRFPGRDMTEKPHLGYGLGFQVVCPDASSQATGTPPAHYHSIGMPDRGKSLASPEGTCDHTPQALSLLQA